MSRRDGYDIVADMLVAIRDSGGKMKPTRLMYKANLSYPQLKKFLAELLDKSLIETSTSKTHEMISITDKGFDFINKYLKAKEFEKSFGLEI